jgi:hypothetical protein
MNIDVNNIKKYSIWKNKWEDQSAINLQQYVSFNIHPDDVLIVGKLFFPDIIEVNECVFLMDNYDKNVYQKIRTQYRDDNKLIERTINHIYIYDYFANCKDNIDNTTFEYVGNVLRFSWQIYFSKVFPEKEFVVEYNNDEQEYGPTLTFYHK